MNGLSHFVVEAGWGIYPVFVFGSASLAAAIAQARVPRPQLLAVVVALGVLTLLAGALGTVTGLQASVRYITELTLTEKWIFLVGLRESLNSTVAALLLVSLDALVITAAMSLRLLRASGQSATVS